MKWKVPVTYRSTFSAYVTCPVHSDEKLRLLAHVSFPTLPEPHSPCTLSSIFHFFDFSPSVRFLAQFAGDGDNPTFKCTRDHVVMNQLNQSVSKHFSQVNLKPC